MDEYEAMIAALKETGIPFAEDGWDTKPGLPYGVYAIDGGAGALWAGDRQISQGLQGTVDLFTGVGSARVNRRTVENAIKQSGVSFWYNSEQYESDKRLMHYEWVFEVTDDGED